MHNYQFHSVNLIQYDLSSQFTHKSFYHSPKFEKITLNFWIKEINFKALVLVMSTLEAIASQKPIPTKSTKSNIFLKIRKGAPVGCKLTLRKSNMFTFFSKLVLLILPKIKLFEGVSVKRKIQQENSFSFSLYDLLTFPELEIQYELFQNIPKLDISILTQKIRLQESQVLLTGSRIILQPLGI